MAMGLARVLPAEALTIVVNVGDDDWFHGLRVCPDLDTVTYTLSDQVNAAQAWGVAGDATRALDVLKRLGATDTWMTLGDADFGVHLHRTARLAAGETLTDVTAGIAKSFGLNVRILPATNNELATRVVVDEGRLRFQEWFVQRRCEPRVRGLQFEGADEASATPEVLQALREAALIVFAPSNPLLSVLPMLKIADIDEAIRTSRAVKVAVSPLINGVAVKGPLHKLLRELHFSSGNRGIAEFYRELIDGIIIDQSDHVDGRALEAGGLRVLSASTRIATAPASEELARRVIRWVHEWSLSGASA
jgi:LPPG:FO 2-phospho-L-lactate transferase